MIDASHITFDGDTAWLVEDRLATRGAEQWRALDRLCDWCGGYGYLLGEPDHYERGTDAYVPCDDCRGTGRHLFDIEVESLCMQEGRHELVNGSCHFCGSSGSLSLSVYVVEVLPIVEGLGAVDGPMPRIAMVEGRGNYLMRPFVYPSPQITLPSAAAPGMWAVRLAVHKEKLSI